MSDIADADAVVIGAGAFGLSTALNLAHLGMKDVIVLEQFEAGSQTSRRAAGLFKHIQPDPTRTALARLSVERVLSFEQDFGVPLPFARSGSLKLARTPEHAEVTHSEYRNSRSWDVDVEMIDPAEAHRVAPYLEAEGISAVAYVPGDIYIEEPNSLLTAYQQAGERLGVRVMEHTPATGITVRGGEVQSVTTPGGEIRTPVVVDAAGPWARLVGEMAPAPVQVATVRHQLFITEPIGGIEHGWPILRIIDTAVYVRPSRGGLMLGGFEPDPLPFDMHGRGPEFSAADVPLDLSVLRDLSDTVNRSVPALQDADLAEYRGGLFTMTPDGRFLAGPVPEIQGLWMATGCNGSGFSFSPGIGQTLAEWIVEGEPSIDMTVLAPARFADVRLDDAELEAAGVWQYTHYYDPDASRPAQRRGSAAHSTA